MSKSKKIRGDRRSLYEHDTDFTAPKFYGCIRKTSYRVERIAQQAADELMNTGTADKPLRVYKCPDCKNFHLTSSTFIKKTQK